MPAIKSPNQKKKTVVLIDGHALIHRAYHALPPLTTAGGEIVNAVYGFVSLLLKMYEDLKPDYVLAAFDLPGPTFRHDAFEEKQSQDCDFDRRTRYTAVSFGQNVGLHLEARHVRDG